MDIQTILISSAVTTSLYAALKSGIHLYKNYYLKSECHNNNQLIIEIVTNPSEEKKEEEKKEEVINLDAIIPSPALPQV